MLYEKFIEIWVGIEVILHWIYIWSISVEKLPGLVEQYLEQLKGNEEALLQFLNILLESS